MNYCDAIKTVWWAPPRTGTRAIGAVLQHVGFLPRPASHGLKFPEGKEDYALFCNVRNPFSRLVSVWRWHTTIGSTEDEFKVWAGLIIAKEPTWLFFEDLLEGKQYTPIRLENLVEDLGKIPTLSQTLAAKPAAQKDYNLNILKNRYQSSKEPYHLQYDQVTVDFVAKAFAKQFEMFGYKKTLE